MQISEAERGRDAYRDDPYDDDDDDVSEHRRLLSPAGSDSYGSLDEDEDTRVGNTPIDASKDLTTYRTQTTLSASTTSLEGRTEVPNSPDLLPTPANGNVAPHKQAQIKTYDEEVGGFQGATNRFYNHVNSIRRNVSNKFSSSATRVFSYLPSPIQWLFRKVFGTVGSFLAGLWEFMNPPLWAMLIAIVVASVPKLQHLFFDNGTFVRNSVTRAVEQSGGVAVPLILVVLGGNLARNTLPKAGAGEITDPKEERRLLIASLVSRMVLPTIIMAPLLALTAKYVSVSILEDKIFIIVCFLLTGAPTALQLAQICQINNVYMPVMSNILFQSYVIWILPSTLMLVLLALETVEWASL